MTVLRIRAAPWHWPIVQSSRKLSTHRPSQWVVLFLFAPFLLLTGHNLLSSLEGPVSYDLQLPVAIFITLFVWGAFAAAIAFFMRRRVVLSEEGIHYHGADRSVFLAWDEIDQYEFKRSYADGHHGGHAALGDALTDGFFRRRSTRFSFSGGGNTFSASVSGGGRNIGINGMYTRMRRFCETVVDRLDPKFVNDALERLKRNETVSFGELALSRHQLYLKGEPITLKSVREVSVLDGQVNITMADKTELRLGAVPNAYALRTVIDQLNASDSAEPGRHVG
ncbi:MAG: hypothetical protein IT381_32825 [Deltaproteobacteria bacterium]|nr:hypothetical protein [Deltaproteobacteria bacterium]